MNPVIWSALAGAAIAALTDLMGFVRARQEWRSKGEVYQPMPTFDIPLCAARVVAGLITGALAGAGINHTIGANP